MFRRRPPWLSLLVLLVAWAFHGTVVRGDADFDSVRVRMAKDHSGKAGDPKGKYWRKCQLVLHSNVKVHIAKRLGIDEST